MIWKRKVVAGPFFFSFLFFFFFFFFFFFCSGGGWDGYGFAGLRCKSVSLLDR